jgi:hypothetical protein
LRGEGEQLEAIVRMGVEEASPMLMLRVKDMMLSEGMVTVKHIEGIIEEIKRVDE